MTKTKMSIWRKEFKKYGLDFTHKTVFTVDDILQAGFMLEPVTCKHCSEDTVVYEQYQEDGCCEMCGKWQVNLKPKIWEKV